MKRIAVLHHGSPGSAALKAFRASLLRQGLVEGLDCEVDAVGAEGCWSRLPVLAQQLLQRQPHVLVAIGAIAALSAQGTTSTVPIRYAIVLDPVDIGLVAANVSGVSSFDPRQAARHLRLLQELLPGLRRVAFLTDVDAPPGRDGRSPLVSELTAAAERSALELHGVALSGREVRLEPAFDSLLQRSPQVLVALEVPTVLARLSEIVELADRHRLPMLTPFGWSACGLIAEGASLHDALEPLAESVASVLRGGTLRAKAVRVAHHPRLVLRTGQAQRLGLPIPAALLQRATEIDSR